MKKAGIVAAAAMLSLAVGVFAASAEQASDAGEGAAQTENTGGSASPGYIFDVMHPQNEKPGESGSKPGEKKNSGPFVAFDVSLGNFSPNSSPGLMNESGGFTVGLGLAFVPKRTISYRLEYFSTERKYDTTVTIIPPLFYSVDDRMTLATSALLFGLRVSYPGDRSYRFHVDGGIGMFDSSLSLEGWLSFFPFESVTYLEDKDSSLGYHAGGGIEIDVGRSGFISLDYRQWFVHASFPSFGLDNADIGGDCYAFRFGWFF